MVAMPSSDFWRDLSAQFLKLPDPGKELRADWAYQVGSGEIGDWTLTGIPNRFLKNQFEVLAKRGAMEIASDPSTELLIVWLEALRKDGSDFRISSTGSSIDTVIDRDVQLVFGSIFHICEASASFCKKQESRALQTEFNERHSSAPTPPKTASPALPATETVAEQISRLREECRLTVEELAEKIGVEPRSVQRHEAGASEPYARHWRAYEREFSKILKRQIFISKLS